MHSLVARRRRLGRAVLAAVLPIALAAFRAGAQGTVAPTMIGGDADERLRLGQLLSGGASSLILIRSTSRLITHADTAGAWSVQFGLPELRAVRNSGFPYSVNDGPLWAGRGWNESVTPMAALRIGPVRLVLAPTLVSSDNEIFQVIPYPQNSATPRSVWANPFHPPPESIDLPERFGDRRLERGDPGQSSLSIDAGPVVVGAGTENLWWGPGIRNAITLSNNAPGFPHLSVSTRQPWHTRAGTFEGQWIVGALTESAFFDTVASNNTRSLSGVIATWTPPFDTTLTLGVSRLVMATRTSGAFPLSSAFDVLRSVGHLDVDLTKPVPTDARDQIFSAFARWLLPAAGFEAYAEWARFEEPRSLQDFIEYPEHSQGYTLGFQWAHPLAGGRAFRLQSEASYMEPDPSLRLRPVATAYTSRAVPQGFTQRGQMLGPAIGPDASSQWIAGDLFARNWRIGPYLGRIRWDDGTLEEPIVPPFKRQDVSMLGGVRAGVTWRGIDVLLDYSHTARFNYLFQAYLVTGTEHTTGIDLVNNSLSLTLSTALQSLRVPGRPR